MAAREEVLARLRAAVADVPATETVDDVVVRREYRREGEQDEQTRLATLVDRLVDYRATVHRTTNAELARTVGSVLAAAGCEHLVTAADVPGWWLTGYDGAVDTDRADTPLEMASLDNADSVLTGCAVAVAATGTIVLDGGRAQGRRALTLVPDHHVCVVPADRVVDLVPEALRRLDPTRPLTFISGPSATSDIELNRVEGVHGPRRLDVVLVT